MNKQGPARKVCQWKAACKGADLGDMLKAGKTSAVAGYLRPGEDMGLTQRSILSAIPFSL